MVLLTWKDALKSVSMRLGGPFVTLFGVQMMEMWLASNLASQRLVCNLITVYIIAIYMTNNCV